MVLVQGRAERLVGQDAQEYNYFWEQTGSNIWMFPVKPAELTVRNLDNHPTEVRLYRYRDVNTNTGFMGQFTLPIGGARTFTWNTVDPNWNGVALNAWKPAVGVLLAQLDYPAPVGEPCQFGTERRDSSQAIIQLTPDLIGGWLAAAGATQLTAAFSVFWYLFISSQDLCQQGPPPLPFIDSSFSDAPLETKLQALRYIAWNHLCQCVPGIPPPTPMPPTVIVIHGDQPPPLTFPCDPAFICDSIVAIRQQLAALAQTVTSSYALATLIQRYQAPFAYILGATHSGLTGSGVIQIPRSIGVLVSVQSRPATLKTLTGAPEYIFDLGWVSAVAANGMCDEIRVTRDVQIWQSRLIPECGTIGYAFREDVTASITEMYAEP